MEFVIEIERREDKNSGAYRQSFVIEDDGSASIAAVLETLNSRSPLMDADGKPAAPIAWECGCLQRKCGACAMRINEKPALACSFFLSDLKNRGNTVTLKPLSKFPIISDLTVDRSAIFDGLKKAKLWLDEDARLSERDHEAQYQSARCLMCGCCLEVCPNFIAGGDFGGAATAAAAYRALGQSGSGEHRSEMKAQYRARYFGGCGKSLSCHDICPIGLPIEDLIVRANKMAVWGR
jgi:succinate dehydrogenase / fumarate reductase iron-sulfur subunit